MNQELHKPFIAAAAECFRRLSECPELKNYRIYREPESLPRQQIQECTPLVGNYAHRATTPRHWAGKWILVVSAKRLGTAQPLVVKVQGCRG